MRPYLFYSAVSLVLSGFLIFFFLLPKYHNFILANEELARKIIELQSQGKYFQELQKTKEELGNYGEALSKIDTALPQNPSLPALLKFIQASTSQSGLILERMSPPNTVSLEQKPKETRMTFGLRGAYPAFKNFISVLEKSARFIEVEGVSFSPAEKEEINFLLDIKVYSY